MLGRSHFQDRRKSFDKYLYFHFSISDLVIKVKFLNISINVVLGESINAIPSFTELSIVLYFSPKPLCISSPYCVGLLKWVWRRLRLYYCDGNFRVTKGLRGRNRILVERFLCINSVLSSDQVRISHMNRELSCRIMWYIVAWSHHYYSVKSQEYFIRNLKYKLIAHGVDARLHGSEGVDILHGSAANSRQAFCHSNIARVRADWKEINPPTETFCSFHKKNSGSFNFDAMHQ